MHLIEQAERSGTFTIAGVVTSEPDCRDLEQVAARRVPVVQHDIHAFYASRSARLTRDWQTRELYDEATLAILRGFEPDIVLLDGYLYLLTARVLDAFPNRLLNLHFSDLTMREADARPTFPGIRAVRDAIVAGECETFATVHLVNQEPDGGPPLLRSWAFPVSPLVSRARTWQAADMLKAYAYAHQEWMLRDASGPLLDAAVHLVTSGRVSLDALALQPPHTTIPWTIEANGELRPPSVSPHAAGTVPQQRGSRRRECRRPWTSGRSSSDTRAAAREGRVR